MEGSVVLEKRKNITFIKSKLTINLQPFVCFKIRNSSMQSFIKYPTDSERFNPDPPFYRKKKYTYITFYQIKIADKSKSKQKLLFSKEKSHIN